MKKVLIWLFILSVFVATTEMKAVRTIIKRNFFGRYHFFTIENINNKMSPYNNEYPSYHQEGDDGNMMVSFPLWLRFG